MEDRCVCCGEIIPECRMVCMDCEKKVKEKKTKKQNTKKIKPKSIVKRKFPFRF